MRLRPPRDLKKLKDLEKLRINIGDVVIYEGVRQVVTQVGLRYLTVYQESDDTKREGLVKVSQVFKAPPPEIKEDNNANQ